MIKLYENLKTGEITKHKEIMKSWLSLGNTVKCYYTKKVTSILKNN